MKRLTKTFAFVLALVVMLAATPVTAEAATAKPAKTSISTLKQVSYGNGKANIKVIWKKVKKNCKGYTVYTSANKKNWKVAKTVSNAKKTFATISITAGTDTRMYITVKAYNKSGKKKVYSKMSSVKSIRISNMTNTPDTDDRNDNNNNNDNNNDSNNDNNNNNNNNNNDSNDDNNNNNNDSNNNNNTNKTCKHNWQAVTHTVTVTDTPAYDETKEVTKEYDWMDGGGRVVCDDNSLYNPFDGPINFTAIDDKDIVINAALANEPNCKLADGTLVTAPGALFENVTLIAGYSFPRELFLPATYNGEEVKFWDNSWMNAYPETEEKYYNNCFSNGWINAHPEIEKIYNANRRAYDNAIQHIKFSMPSVGGCRTIDDMLAWQGKGYAEFDQNSSNIRYFEQYKTIGNEMLWNYFRPGEAHTYGEPFTYTTTETIHHEAVTHTETVTDGYRCTKCGATK